MLVLLLLGATLPPSELGSSWGLPQILPAWSAWLGDLDQDGQLELITVAHQDHAWHAWTPDGFMPREGLPEGIDRHGMTSCDVDRDGLDELLVAVGGNRGAGGAGSELFSGREDLGPAVLAGTGGTRSRGATCADSNADGMPELWIAAMGKVWPDRFVEWTEDGWQETARKRRLDASRTTMGGRWADLDGDRDLDLVRFSGSAVEVLRHRKNGSFHVLERLRLGHVQDVVVEDLDGDGDADVYIARGNDQFDAADDGYLRVQVEPGVSRSADYLLPDGCTRLRFTVQGDVSGERAPIHHAGGTVRVTGSVRVADLERDRPRGNGLRAWFVEPRVLRIESSGGRGEAQVSLVCRPTDELPVLVERTPFLPPEPAPDVLLLNEGWGTFVEAELPQETAALHTADAIEVDLDLDGHLDLVLVTQRDADGRRSADQWLRREGAGWALHALDQTDTPYGEGHVGLAGDLDGDDHPELIVFNGEHLGLLGGTPTVWQNPGSEHRGLRVQVLDGDARSLSAIVRVETDHTQQRLSNPAPDWRSNGGTAELFGLGTFDRAAVTVIWPDGERVRRVGLAGTTLVVRKPVSPSGSPG
ncbi:MAG: VCBS repeat-containing protein [Proteobacteria bacterium]|nr:VCBS repeat-containing protein [Pseudomonadota bacterium]MCP4916371.1 VCBS repeat-containing protein [Pseudomonadota bacterium]